VEDSFGNEGKVRRGLPAGEPHFEGKRIPRKVKNQPRQEREKDYFEGRKDPPVRGERPCAGGINFRAGTGGDSFPLQGKKLGGSAVFTFPPGERKGKLFPAGTLCTWTGSKGRKTSSRGGEKGSPLRDRRERTFTLYDLKEDYY